MTNTDVINILAVDDVPQNLVTIDALLARPGLNVIKASSGPQALEVLLAHEVALILVDVQMPQMDGFELAELIRGSARTRSVPLIFLTAGACEAKTTFRGWEAGAVDFLYKPLDVAALKSKVNVFVELHAKEKQLSRQLEELRQALALNEMFTAVLGHDLRNPLSAVLNGAELVLRASSEPTVQAAAGRIRNSGRRMARMVEQLLDVARIRAGAIELRLDATDYAALCQNVAEELEGEHWRQRVAIDTVGDVEGTADSDRMLQILSNLLANALQHGVPDQPVRIVIDGTAERTIELRVQNGGVIAQDLVDRIFEPFHGGPGCKPTQGLGLGLFIVKTFVALHGGQVTLTSNQEVGTMFRLVLPRHAAPLPPGRQRELALFSFS